MRSFSEQVFCAQQTWVCVTYVLVLSCKQTHLQFDTQVLAVFREYQIQVFSYSHRDPSEKYFLSLDAVDLVWAGPPPKNINGGDGRGTSVAFGRNTYKIYNTEFMSVLVTNLFLILRRSCQVIYVTWRSFIKNCTAMVNGNHKLYGKTPQCYIPLA